MINNVKQIKLFGDRILIKLEEKEKITAGGIVIPDTKKPEKTDIAEVVSIGNNVEFKTLKLGYRVVYDKYAGIDLKIGDSGLYKIIKSEDILALDE